MQKLQLKSLRMSKGLTKDQLAEKMKVSVETISSLENGLLIKIASFFSVTLEYLVTGCRIKKDHIELLRIYNSLDEINKGMLLERALYLAEESPKKTESSR